MLPAFSDMHVHLEGQAWNVMFPAESKYAATELDFSRILFPYIANGVTTVQVMSALPEHVALRDRIEQGEILGPRLVLCRMIDGPEKAWPPPISTWVADASEARQAVLDSRKTGYDKIKVYSFLSKESYDSIQITAEEISMPVVGHVPMSLSVEDVLDARQQLIAHAEEVMKHAQGNYGEDRIRHYARIIAKSDTWMTPTLVNTRAIMDLFDDPASALAGPKAKYLHPMARGMWAFMHTNLYEPIPPEHRQGIRDGFERFQQPLTAALVDAEAKLMTGTDSLLPGLVPGFALHRELKELVDVGLSPYEALRASTTSPSDFLGELNETGTIEKGKRAELVLLEKNPLEDIEYSRTVVGVMTRGRWLSKEDLREGLQGVVDYNNAVGK